MPPKPPHQSIIQTEFDERTIGRSTQLLKALIPFLEPSQQKMFGLMVRIIEFNMTLDFFNHNRIPACMFKPPCGDDMLSELKGYCSPEEQKQLDMMIGMIKAQKIQAALNSTPHGHQQGDGLVAGSKIDGHQCAQRDDAGGVEVGCDGREAALGHAAQNGPRDSAPASAAGQQSLDALAVAGLHIFNKEIG